MTLVIIITMIAVGLAITSILIGLRRQLTNQIAALIEVSAQHFQHLDERLDAVDDKLNVVEFNTLSETEKEIEKERRTFERAGPLTLSNVRAFKMGQAVRLISRSWMAMNDKPFVALFDYKHDHIDETNSSKYGYEVHGYSRFSDSDDWTPYRFLSSEEESQTITCEGTIRRRH